MQKIKRLLFLCVILMGSIATYAQQTKEPAPFVLREGKHNLTLQWVSWNQPGKAVIKKKKDGTYSIQGEQRGADNAGFVTIDGVLKVVSAKELEFEGTIRTKDNSINGGEVCEKKGTYHFLAKGARKYWRLQEMENCEGNNVVDYVDIFF
ncbi:hypothetical protein [Chitinophaga nivalis]|uniref:Uncharacterized protein n=1 Tax=Chitinophaga nivalis TaxID=2991709 RepID=A0ABT3IMQ9_9BACT|nr:hypothetical protein [Chitinophaga nivalis]MCW3465071.1 hypothetical protein [Chitinophaga nivalis]MCW3485237.1 hypothetical protein [Chitinophaga nivalis]